MTDSKECISSWLTKNENPHDVMAINYLNHYLNYTMKNLSFSNLLLLHFLIEIDSIGAIWISRYFFISFINILLSDLH